MLRKNLDMKLKDIESPIGGNYEYSTNIPKVITTERSKVFSPIIPDIERQIIEIERKERNSGN
jgi:hypothetical protein